MEGAAFRPGALLIGGCGVNDRWEEEFWHSPGPRQLIGAGLLIGEGGNIFVDPPITKGQPHIT